MEKIHFKLIKEKHRALVFDLMLKLKKHSRESFVHSVDVAKKSIMLADSLGVKESDRQTLYTASLLHDIGKLCIDRSILHKTNVTDEEKEYIRLGHIEATKSILSHHFDEDVVNLATHHHERLNRSGYPEHLNGREMSLLDKILQVADVTSALSLNRSYQDARAPKEVIAILEELSSKHELDRKCVQEISKICLGQDSGENQNENQYGS